MLRRPGSSLTESSWQGWCAFTRLNLKQFCITMLHTSSSLVSYCKNVTYTSQYMCVYYFVLLNVIICKYT